jgi:cytochrome c oxidase subunit 1
LNEGITIAALIVGAVQVVFLYNLIWSYFKGKPAGGNPWRATTLEWQTPHTPPKHGNFGPELPVVYRWAYDYSVPGAAEDFIPQNQPPSKKSKGLEETLDAAELGPHTRGASGTPKPLGGKP